MKQTIRKGLGQDHPNPSELRQAFTLRGKVAIVLLGFIALSSGSYIRSRGGYAATGASEPEHEVKLSKLADDYNYATPSRSNSSDIYSSGNSRLENEKIAEEQAKSAKYNFALAFDDGIMDSSQVRTESRDGLKVVGSNRYSDGFFKRIVKYEIDEEGYRVIS